MKNSATVRHLKKLQDEHWHSEKLKFRKKEQAEKKRNKLDWKKDQVKFVNFAKFVISIFSYFIMST